MNNHTYKDKPSILGRIGEEIIAYLSNSYLSEDPYDKTKDGTHRLTKKSREIKTQTRHPVPPHRFTVPERQETKCMTVDILEFLTYDNTDVIAYWECIDRTNFTRYTTTKGIRMIGFHPDAMRLVCEIHSKELATLLRYYSTSDSIKDKKSPGYTFDQLGSEGLIDIINKAQKVGQNLQMSLF